MIPRINKLRKDRGYFLERKVETNFLNVPKEFLAMKPTMAAITSFEGRSTLSATAPVLSKMSLALVKPLLIARMSIIKASAIIMKIMDQIVTKIIKAISKGDIRQVYSMSATIEYF